MRAAALLSIIAGGYGVYWATQWRAPEGTVPIFPGVAIAFGVFGFVFALVYALILWGFADALILLCDIDDTQRSTQRQVADLALEQRTARGPFHSERAAEAKPAPSNPT